MAAQLKKEIILYILTLNFWKIQKTDKIRLYNKTIFEIVTIPPDRQKSIKFTHTQKKKKKKSSFICLRI